MSKGKGFRKKYVHTDIFTFFNNIVFRCQGRSCKDGGRKYLYRRMVSKDLNTSYVCFHSKQKAIALFVSNCL